MEKYDVSFAKESKKSLLQKWVSKYTSSNFNRVHKKKLQMSTQIFSRRVKSSVLNLQKMAIKRKAWSWGWKKDEILLRKYTDGHKYTLRIDHKYKIYLQYSVL